MIVTRCWILSVYHMLKCKDNLCNSSWFQFYANWSTGWSVEFRDGKLGETWDKNPFQDEKKKSNFRQWNFHFRCLSSLPFSLGVSRMLVWTSKVKARNEVQVRTNTLEGTRLWFLPPGSGHLQFRTLSRARETSRKSFQRKEPSHGLESFQITTKTSQICHAFGGNQLPPVEITPSILHSAIAGVDFLAFFSPQLRVSKWQKSLISCCRAGGPVPSCLLFFRDRKCAAKWGSGGWSLKPFLDELQLRFFRIVPLDPCCRNIIEPKKHTRTTIWVSFLSTSIIRKVRT